MMNDNELMVTIRCTAYNHEPYIRQCLEGFVMQKTNFRFEAIVHDDASTDGTAAIIREYAEKYPDIIKPIFETENQYSKHDGSLRRIMEAHMHGKYVAMCEGDDYWIDPLKLQTQVDFLEAHPDYSMCFHNAFKLYMQRNKVELFNDKCADEDLSVHDAIHNWLVPTASILVKTDVAINPKWLVHIYSGDYSLILRSINAGRVRYINGIMSVYRINEIGTSATATMKHRYGFVLKQHELLLDSFNKGTEGRYKDEIEKRINWLRREFKFNEAKENRDIFSLMCMPKIVISRVVGRLKKMVNL